MLIKVTVFLICLVLAVSGFGQGLQPTNDTSQSKHEDTKKLMQAVGTAELLQDMLDQSIEQQVTSVRRLRPDVPAQFWTEFGGEMKKEINPQELMDMIVPIYDKHFSHQEIRQLIAFYQSPLGKKISATLPEIQRESLEAGQEWGLHLGDRIADELNRRLAEKGYKLMVPRSALPSRD